MADAEDQPVSQAQPAPDQAQPAPAETQAEQPSQKDWMAPGQVDRTAQWTELQQKPWLHQVLSQMNKGELVSGAPFEHRVIQMETVFNRALDRGHSLEQALWKTSEHGKAGYYPQSTFTRGGLDADDYAKVLSTVVNGSNAGGKYLPEGMLVTGNASDEPGNMVASHQRAKGTPGFTLKGAGGEWWFAEAGKTGRTPMVPGYHGGGEDLTDKYNTKLTAEEAKQFTADMKAVGMDPKKARYDYDAQGAWKSGDWGERYQKPNHPVFSKASMYHGVDGNVGGDWSQRNGGWHFQPSETNLANYSMAQLKDYMSHTEPGSKVGQSTMMEILDHDEALKNMAEGDAPPLVFMRAGNVPKVGAVSSGPSANIEDRRRMGPSAGEMTIEQQREMARQNFWGRTKDFDASPLASQLATRRDLERFRSPPVPLPRPRPRGAPR